MGTAQHHFRLDVDAGGRRRLPTDIAGYKTLPLQHVTFKLMRRLGLAGVSVHLCVCQHHTDRHLHVGAFFTGRHWRSKVRGSLGIATEAREVFARPTRMGLAARRGPLGRGTAEAGAVRSGLQSQLGTRGWTHEWPASRCGRVACCLTGERGAGKAGRPAGPLRLRTRGRRRAARPQCRPTGPQRRRPDAGSAPCSSNPEILRNASLGTLTVRESLRPQPAGSTTQKHVEPTAAERAADARTDERGWAQRGRQPTCGQEALTWPWISSSVSVP